MNPELQIELRNGQSFVDAAKLLFKANRNSNYPYINDLGIETGALAFLVNHSLELALKSYLKSCDPKISKKRMKNRKANIFFSHDLIKLLRHCEILGLNGKDKLQLSHALSSHKYFEEHQEYLDEELQRPDYDEFRRQVFRANSMHNKPFQDRYSFEGLATPANVEVITIAAEFFLKSAAARAK